MIHIRLSDIPPDQWMSVVFVNPMEFTPMYIPGTGMYAIYEAYWPFEKNKRCFDFVLPHGKLRMALNALPSSLTECFDGPVLMEFKRNKEYDISIRKVCKP